MKTQHVKSLRHFSRIPFAAEVSLQLHDRTLQVRLIDIALKGALVQSESAPALALLDKCRLLLPLTDGGDAIEMAGQVVHLEGERIGIECQDIDVLSLTRLRRLLELNAGDADQINLELSQLFARP
ncbi:MAG: PilZ domain-containing protein [Rhodoferax sp.]